MLKRDSKTLNLLKLHVVSILTEIARRRNLMRKTNLPLYLLSLKKEVDPYEEQYFDKTVFFSTFTLCRLSCSFFLECVRWTTRGVKGTAFDGSVGRDTYGRSMVLGELTVSDHNVSTTMCHRNVNLVLGILA